MILNPVLRYIDEKSREEGRKEGRKEGIKEGIVEGKIEVALNMLEKGFSIEDVVECTGIQKNLLL